MKTDLEYIDGLYRLLSVHANSENAGHMSRYMKNHFLFFGIKTPERKALVKQYLLEQGMPQDWRVFGTGLWEQEKREMQYAFNDILEPVISKQHPELLSLFETLIQSRSWWDTVDFLAPRLAGRILLQSPELMDTFPDRWIEHENFWLQRAAIIVQLRWKTQTDENRLFGYIERRADSQEFFVRKAAGWALRQYARVHPDAVRGFVDRTNLHPLTVREALRRIGGE